jgi:hypothetical protein
MPLNRRFIASVILFIAVSVGCEAMLATKYESDRAFLQSVVTLDEHRPASEKVVSLVGFLKMRVRVAHSLDQSFVPGLSFLRPTARQVIEDGGDCADRARLLIVLLRAHGVEAHKVALYDTAGEPDHAVVEAQTEEGPMAVDALYSMYFPRESGGFYSIAEIARNESIVTARLAEMRRADRAFEAYPLGRYIYDWQWPRTINWDKTWWMHASYRVLRVAIGPSVDRMPRPYLVEEPVLMAICAVFVLQGIVLAWLMMIALTERRRRSRSSLKHPASLHALVRLAF